MDWLILIHYDMHMPSMQYFIDNTRKCATMPNQRYTTCDRNDFQVGFKWLRYNG